MRTLSFLLFLVAAAVMLQPAPAQAASNNLDYPIIFVDSDGTTHEAGIFGNRQQRRQAPKQEAPGQEHEDQGDERTQRYSPDNAPKFESQPSDGAAVAGSGSDEAAIDLESIQPWLEVLIPFIAALFGGSLGSGGFSAFLTQIFGLLNKAPAPTRARVRKAARKGAKAAVKKVAQQVASKE